MLVRYICRCTTKFANVYFEPRNIVCTARTGTASGMSVNFSAIMEVGNIERERKTILQMIFIVASQAHPRFGRTKIHIE